jgi:glycosyltransferase involved in cell wall biosynthesis
MKKVLWISDLDMKGSGYFNLSIPFCSGLANKGHDVTVIGLGYHGEEHSYPFRIIPVQNFNEIFATIQNLYNLFTFDILIVALDIPLQEQILLRMQNRPFKYIGIMPIEADPLCFSWAVVLMSMNKALIISKFGTEEAKKMGIEAEHIQIGIDTESWRVPTAEEKQKIRKAFGIEDDTFVVLTVADNQERKNLWAAMDIYSRFKNNVPKSKYIMVTRENNMVGWKLRDMAKDFSISENLMIMERGMGFKELWAIYAMSDIFLLPSKAEGLGLPLMEAMAVGLPCIGTDCTGIKENLSDDRGILIPYEYRHSDPFGNAHRYWINRDDGFRALMDCHDNGFMTDKARKYVEGLSWSIGVETLNNTVENI